VSRILISAAHKSSGKTTVALGIGRALRDQGLRIQTFKKGPDYIDPMWHARASGRSCFNLDFNTQSRDELVGMLAAQSRGADLTLIEGNMGLYDGVDVEGRDSNAALAKLTGAPVVLVVDTEGMTRGIAPLLLGYRVFDPEVHIAGVVLNRVAGPRHEDKLRASIERHTEMPVIGALPREAQFMLPERHLGLPTPVETDAAEDFIARIGQAVASRFDLDLLRRIAALSMPLPASWPVDPAPRDASEARVRIGVARDAAFGFYYPDDLMAFEAAGAQLVFFDALHDAHLPACDGLFIGGGFPETQMAALEANGSLRAEIKHAIQTGLPTYAECGGLMYLSRAICWGEERREMVGVVPAEAIMHRRPQGRGQILLQETASFPWPDTGPVGIAPGSAQASGRIHAHEFHHAALEGLPPSGVTFAFNVERGTGIDGHRDGIVIANTLAGFAHQRNTAANPWVQRFVAFVRRRKSASLVAQPSTETAYGSNAGHLPLRQASI